MSAASSHGSIHRFRMPRVFHVTDTSGANKYTPAVSPDFSSLIFDVVALFQFHVPVSVTTTPTCYIRIVITGLAGLPAWGQASGTDAPSNPIALSICAAASQNPLQNSFVPEQVREVKGRLRRVVTVGAATLRDIFAIERFLVDFVKSSTV